MQKNTIAVLGLVVALLTAWLVIAVALDVSNDNKEAEMEEENVVEVQYPDPNKASKSSDATTEEDVETSVEVVNENVETSVEVVEE